MFLRVPQKRHSRETRRLLSGSGNPWSGFQWALRGSGWALRSSGQALRGSRLAFRTLLILMLATMLQCSPSSEEPTSVSRPPLPAAIQTGLSSPAPTAHPVGLALPANETFIHVSKEAMASVVNIASIQKSERSGRPTPFPFFDDPFFRRFFGEEFERRFRRPQPRREQGLGSGVIVSSNGYIITNHHVVERADEVTVLLGDKRKFPANVIGTDPKTDLAVIKIEADDLPTLPWSDSSTLQVGELVLAVGNPFGLNQTVTMGIISAVGRANMGIVDYEDFIQTDAAINPGNSGGALVNLRGELIGINTAIFSRTGGYQGIGFAIPSNMAKNVMNNLIEHGQVIRGWLGVSIQEVTQELAEQFEAPDASGALIGDVVEDSPAEAAGLQRGDVIRRYNGTDVKDSAHLRALVAGTPPRTTATVTVLRDGVSLERSVTIADLPEDVTALRSSEGGTSSNHVLSGLTVEPVPPGRTRNDEGVLITRVRQGSPAQSAGLRQNDIILEINRRPVRTVEDFTRLTRDLGPQSPVLLLAKRGNGTFYLSIRP